MVHLSMRELQILLTALLFAPQVSAFFPYVPEYKCKLENNCPTAKAKRLTSTSKLEQTLTFELQHRAPEGHVPINIDATIARLAKKYHQRHVGDHGGHLSPIQKRSNGYNVVVANTPTDANSAALNQDGTDFSYFATAKFGSSEKPLYVLMDTGADSTWIMSSSCTSTSCAKHTLFGPPDSTTYKSSSTAFSIAYGSGTVSGTLATDSISIAGFTLNSTFGAATTTSDDFLSFPFDGIMGLGRSPGDALGESFVETLVASKKLKSNIFSVNINRNSDGLKDGEITFGGVDSSKFMGVMTYTALSSTTGSWVVPVDDIGFRNVKSGATGKAAYIDTGTSYSFIPPTDLSTVMSTIDGSTISSDGTTYYVPCNTAEPLQFWFSGVAYNVSAKDWVGGKVGDVCTSNVFARSIVANGAWLLGAVFLKNVYASFDSDQNRIGFAAKPVLAATSTSPIVPASRSSATKVATSPAVSSLLPSTSTSTIPSATESPSLPVQTSNPRPLVSATQAMSKTQSILYHSFSFIKSEQATTTSTSKAAASPTAISATVGSSSATVPFVNAPSAASQPIPPGVTGSTSNGTSTTNALVPAASSSNISAAHHPYNSPLFSMMSWFSSVLVVSTWLHVLV